jgi:hypothetical protein
LPEQISGTAVDPATGEARDAFWKRAPIASLTVRTGFSKPFASGAFRTTLADKLRSALKLRKK